MQQELFLEMPLISEHHNALVLKRIVEICPEL